MTPAELNIYAQAYVDRRQTLLREQLMLLTQHAFLTSRWVWQKRINIERILRKLEQGSSDEQMTDEEMLAVVRGLNALLGGEDHREIQQ